MPFGEYLYRVLADNEDPEEGISARAPEATEAKVSSHVNGLRKSPYISTAASKEKIIEFYELAVKRYEKQKKKKAAFMVVEIDIENLLKDKGHKIKVFDLTIEEERDNYLKNNKKLKNYTKKYEEVLIKGFIPAEYVKVIDLEAMPGDEFSFSGSIIYMLIIIIVAVCMIRDQNKKKSFTSDWLAYQLYDFMHYTTKPKYNPFRGSGMLNILQDH